MNINTIHQITVRDCNNKEIKLGEFFVKNKLLMIINIASPCGYTNFIMKSLVDLHYKYNKKGLEILAFPCMLSESSKCEIDFSKYGQDMFKIPFPIFSVIDINGKNAHQLYLYLKRNWNLRNENKEKLKDIKRNFSKFIVNREGKVLAYYEPTVELAKIEKDLINFLKENKL